MAPVFCIGNDSFMSEIRKLLDIMVALRDPETGCSWDKKQDFNSISAYTIEEAYEVTDAIERNDLHDLKDELGDLLFQVAFHSRLAEELGEFDFNDVVKAINEKMIRRHPHVFGDSSEKDEVKLNAAWEQQKRAERDNKTGGDSSTLKSELDGIASTLPALRWAEKTQKRAAYCGFDWPDIQPVFGKLDEEIDELKLEIGQLDNQQRIEEEMGDVLFASVNIARHLKVNPEQALRSANRRFMSRFAVVERLLAEDGKEMQDCGVDMLEAYWQKAKKLLATKSAQS